MKLLLKDHDWTLAYKIESNFRSIISEQESYGWKIDTDLLDKLLIDLHYQRDQILDEAYALVPLNVINQGEIVPFKKDGKPTVNLTKWYNSLPIRLFPMSAVAGPFTKVNFEQINLESAKQRIEVLETFGWKPTEYNYKTDKNKRPILGEDGKKIILSPKLTDDSVINCDIKRAKTLGLLLLDYVQVSHRYKLLKGLQDLIEDDGAIHSGGLTVGANTGRMMHRGIVNIPSVGSFYGKECRSIFSSREGYCLIGADLKSLENRLIAHYTFPYDKGEYALRLEEEDSHEATVNLFATIGINIDRSTAKTCNYALGFGAQVKKVSEILGVGMPLASKAYHLWWSDKQSMKNLKEAIERGLKSRGQYDGKALGNEAWIKGLDGRKIFVRSPHSLINCLIQNAGAVVCKFITCAIDKEIKARGLDAHFVIVYHDEVDIEVKRNDLTIESVSAIIRNAVIKCNEYFKFNIPMEMDIKVGASWYEVH